MLQRQRGEDREQRQSDAEPRRGVGAGLQPHLDHAVPSARPSAADPVDFGLSHRNNVQDPALEDHRDPIRDLEQLLEVLADHDDGAAARPELEQLALHELLGRDVQPRVGCAATSTRGSNASSRASSAFCRLPPESVPVRLQVQGARIPNFSIWAATKRLAAPWFKMPGG